MAGDDSQGNPDDNGDEHGKGAQQDGVGDAVEKLGEHLIAAQPGGSEVAAENAGNIADVLDDDRLVEPHLGSFGGQCLGGGVLAQYHGGGVAWSEVQYHKDDKRDSQYHWDQKQQTLYDIFQQVFPSRNKGRFRAHRRARKRPLSYAC